MARDLAQVLGASSRGDGYLYGARYVVTWAIGHLVQLPSPSEIDPAWKSWRGEHLPMLPREWPLQIGERTRDQYRVLEALLRHPQIERVVCATDAGREGELIFRYIVERARCSRPVDRLWISSLTPDAIREGFSRLRPSSAYDALAAAARGRSIADWLVGMNLTRAYTIARGERDQVYSVGRVQTPTLAMVVERELAIRQFVPESYREVAATFCAEGESESAAASYVGVYFDAELERRLRGEKVEDAIERSRRLPVAGGLAERIAVRARTGQARVEALEAKQHKLAAPQLYDLTELQRHANRLWGWSAQRTLELAQALYERHKLLSYPRTDSRHLSGSVAQTLPGIVGAIADGYRGLLAPGTGDRPLGSRFVDDAKVSDHHAILPTTVPVSRTSISEDERRLYDLVCRRLLSAWHDDHLYSVTTVVSAIAHPEGIDRYRTSGTRVDRPGWRVLEPVASRAERSADADPADAALPPGLIADERLDVLDASVLDKRTRPPRRLTEAALLTAMQTAGKTLDDQELAAAMRDGGLGTPATRASIIETLLERGYVTREKKALAATEKGIALVAAVHPDVRSPSMTGRWEAELQRIERGQAQLAAFLARIEAYVADVVERVRADPPRCPAAAPDPSGRASPEPVSPPASEARWIQRDGAWCVRAPAGKAGSSVQVRRRDGSCAEVQLGDVLAEERDAAIYLVASR